MTRLYGRSIVGGCGAEIHLSQLWKLASSSRTLAWETSRPRRFAFTGTNSAQASAVVSHDYEREPSQREPMFCEGMMECD
jgi:hypothetical protein